MTEPFNSCFISYRHPATKGNREESLIKHVVKAITDHIELYTHDHPVYFDEKDLIPGYNYDERIAEAICRSACMVIVYWPSYLESDYCKKEIEAMLNVEERRHRILGDKLRGCRLFIPIILRGKFDQLPDRVRNNCQYLDYYAQTVNPHFNIGDDPKMSVSVHSPLPFPGNAAILAAISAGETPALPGGETPALPGGETPALPGGETPALPGGSERLQMSQELLRIAEYIKGLCDKMKGERERLFGNCQQFGFSSQEGMLEIPPAPQQPFPGR